MLQGLGLAEIEPEGVGGGLPTPSAQQKSVHPPPPQPKLPHLFQLSGHTHQLLGSQGLLHVKSASTEGILKRFPALGNKKV